MIHKSVNKTDKHDARSLAFFLSRDMLAETRLKSTAESELSSLVATRDVFVKQRTMLLHKIHATFVRRGTKLKKEGLASKTRLLELDMSQFTALEQVELNALGNQAPASVDIHKPSPVSVQNRSDPGIRAQELRAIANSNDAEMGDFGEAPSGRGGLCLPLRCFALAMTHIATVKAPGAEQNPSRAGDGL